MIIVIDGPSGSGKSSTAKAVAERLGIEYLDSGALYRAVTLVWLEAGEPEESFLDILTSKEIRFTYQEGRFQVWIDGRDVDREIRTPDVSDRVSQVAAISEVRRFVNELMRERVREGYYIADGRDLGTAVFPNADLKFYMDAALETRAGRRHKELVKAGESVSLEDVTENLRSRDQADRSREDDPLAEAEDAIWIDNTAKGFDDQVGEICTIIQEKLDHFIN